MTARERIQTLMDPQQPYFELGSLAGFEMYEDHGGCPAAGVVRALGYVSNRVCIVVEMMPP